MISLPVLNVLCTGVVGFLLILLFLKLLAFRERDDVFPAHVVLYIGDRSELSKEAFATKRGATFTGFCDGLVIFGTVKNIIEIHFIQLLVLLRVVLVEPDQMSAHDYL